jgi:outer membrane receptor protein involved in Fe transport
VTWYNLPLFVNDSLDGKTFYTKNEAELRAFNLHAEVGYIQEEKFQLRFTVDWFNYTKQKTEVKPWGLVPFQTDAFAQYTIGSKLHLNANMYFLGSSYYQLPNKDFAKTKSGWDLNAGANYDIGKNFNLWVNANNIFNTKYQRWNGYSTYGFNILGGVMIKF